MANYLKQPQRTHRHLIWRMKKCRVLTFCFAACGIHVSRIRDPPTHPYPHKVVTTPHQKPRVVGTSSCTGIICKSSMRRAETTLPAARMPEARGISRMAFAERALSSLLLIWLPVLVAHSSNPKPFLSAPWADVTLSVTEAELDEGIANGSCEDVGACGFL